MKITVTEISAILKANIINHDPCLITGVSIDTRTINQGDIFFAIHGNNNGHDFLDDAKKKGANAYIVSESFIESKPHISDFHNVIVVPDTTIALQNFAAHYIRTLKTKTIVITGSCGKTSVKDIIIHLLSQRYKVRGTRENLNNYLGVPLTIFELQGDEDFCVIEIGINQAGEMDLLAKMTQPFIGVITNIGKAHLENFKNTAGVLNEKWKITEYIQEEGVLVANGDDDMLHVKLTEYSFPVITFGMKAENNIVGILKEKADSEVLEVTFSSFNETHAAAMNLHGTIGLYNSIAALSVGIAVGLEPGYLMKQLETYQPVMQMRFEKMEIKGITIINDAYNANPTSMEKGLRACAAFKVSGKKIVVLGDMLELGNSAEEEHKHIGTLVFQLGFDFIFGYGKLAKMICDQAIKEGCVLDSVIWSENKKDITKHLCNIAQKNDMIYFKGSRLVKLEEIIEEFERILL